MIKKIVLFIAVLACAVIQLSFLNPSYLGLNLILAFTVALALTQEISFTLPAAWLAGFIVDLNKTFYFGITSLVFITLAVIITLGHRFFLSRRRAKNIIILGALAVILERALYLIFINFMVFIKGGFYESLGTLFATSGFLVELLVTPVAVLGLFKLLFNEQEKTIKFSNRT